MEGRLTFAAVMILAILGLLYSEVCGSPLSDHRHETLTQKQECLSKFGEFDKRQVAVPRIVGGEYVDERIFPFIVILVIIVPETKPFQCGGSILNEHWIVTAAHCMAYPLKPKIFVLIGSNSKTEGRRYDVELQIPHENFLDETNIVGANDIGLLKLVQPIEFVPGVERMKLPEPFEEVPLGTEVIAAGWGDIDLNGTGTTHLKMVKKRITTAKLLAFLSEVEHSQLFAEADYPDMIFKGDSGGPLLWGDKVVGITSWTYPGRARGFPSVFTKLSYFILWIDEKIDQKYF